MPISQTLRRAGDEYLDKINLLAGHIEEIFAAHNVDPALAMNVLVSAMVRIIPDLNHEREEIFTAVDAGLRLNLEQQDKEEAKQG